MNQSPNSPKRGQETGHLPAPGGKLRPLRWLLQACLLLGAIYLLHLHQVRHVVEGPAPAFSGRLLDGERVSLQDFRGQPVLLHFWATWCPVCRLEQAAIDEISRDYAVLSVALDDISDDVLQDWMTEQGVSFAVIRDPGGVIAGKFGVSAVPSSLIIDANGNIRFVEVGYTTELGLRLRLWWISV